MEFTKSRLLIIGIGVLIVAVILGALFLGRKPRVVNQDVNLEVWGIFDDSDVWRKIIADFEGKFPGVSVTYRKKTLEDYEKELVNAFAAGRGPDIWYFHNTWLPKHRDKITPLPEGRLTITDYKRSFVDVVSNDFVQDNVIYASPLFVDTLALYWNKDIFFANGLTAPPVTWVQFNEAVKHLTKLDERGNISRAGAAIGSAENVNRSPDILSLLMLQSGVSMTDSSFRTATFNYPVNVGGRSVNGGEQALRYYTDFARAGADVYTWNPSLHYSIDAFYEGSAAMMLNYSYHVPTIKAKSPFLNFDVAKMPQISPDGPVINYANYWGLTVSKNTASPKVAWDFVLFAASRSEDYLASTRRPAAQLALIEKQKNDLEVGVFATQNLTAKSWYQADNNAIDSIFARAIEAVVRGEMSPGQAVEQAAGQVTLIMGR